MRITIPVLFERGEKGSVFTVRPLLFPNQLREGKVLKRALERLARDLRKEFPTLLPSELVLRCSYPAISIHRIRVTGMLRKTSLNERFLAVTFPSELGRVCFLPAFDPQSIAWSRAPVAQPKSLRHGVWMLIPRGKEIGPRVRDTVEQIFRKNPELKPEWFKLQGWTDVTPLRINVDIKSSLKLKKSTGSVARAILGGQNDFKGAEEIAKTSINLSQMYPEQLQRSFLRTQQTESLEQLLWARQKRATLVVGPAGVGKTALVHEMVFRHEQRRELEKKAKGKREVFELSPRLVIAGMSYVGQWQQRMLAILKEVEKRDHILFVSDLIDMFNVGQSSSSKTTISSVLKPFIERGRLRFVGEASPEVFRILKEKDRGFADLFKVVRLDPVDDSTTLSILIRSQRPLERDHGVTIRADALSRTVELQRRFVRDRVFPGKAVSFLESLARRHGGKSSPAQLDSLHATYLFAEWSGLSLGILKSNVKMTKDLVLGALESRVIGQREACEAISNSILVTKAGLNNPQKPLACFLFIGPTGVGKTEAAKAAASYLYGSKERLLRFDMNEFPDAASVARLIGTGFREDGDAADGLLTGRVRLKPFSVILFDEIEKAHHSIYDLLLQVLDEGHLTDAAGRSADFSNAIIILTSNLGVLRARGVADLPGGRSMTRGIYREEVERFFRPEFVNRLDKIIPFDSLKSQDIQKITRLVVEDALGRDGLRRRRVVLNLDEHVIDKLVELGTDEDLGARPLKRAVTQLIMEPLGRQLAATTPAQTTIAWVRSDKKDGVTVSLQIVENRKVLQLPEGECLEDRVELSELIESGLQELRDLLRESSGGEKVIDISDLRPKVRMRYRLLEELEDLETKFSTVKVSSKDGSGRRFRGSAAAARQRKTTREKIRRHDAPALVHQPDDDLEDYINQQNRARAHPDKQLRSLQELRRYGAALTSLTPATKVETESACLLGFWSLAPLKGQLYLELLADMYRELAHLFGHEAEILKLESPLKESLRTDQHYTGLWLKGAAPDLLFPKEQGIHLIQPRGMGPIPIAIRSFQGQVTDTVCPKASQDFVNAILQGEEALPARESLRLYEVLDDPSAPRDEKAPWKTEVERIIDIESQAASPLAKGLKRQSTLPKSYRNLEILLRVTDHRSGAGELMKWPVRDLLPVVELLYQVFPLAGEAVLNLEPKNVKDHL